MICVFFQLVLSHTMCSLRQLVLSYVTCASSTSPKLSSSTTTHSVSIPYDVTTYCGNHFNLLLDLMYSHITHWIELHLVGGESSWTFLFIFSDHHDREMSFQ
jgi:hypothetical protein